MEEILMKAACYVAIIVLGFVLRKTGFFGPEAFGVLSKIVIKITLPCAIISGNAGRAIDKSLLTIILLSFGAGVLYMILGSLIYKKKGKDAQAFGILNIPGYNIGTFAMPFTQNFLGPLGNVATSLFDMGNALICLGGAYGALIHVVVQTGPVFSHIPWKLFAATGQLQSQPNGLHDAVGYGSAAVGTEIFRPVIGNPADQLNFRVNILHIQPQIGVALVILEKNIIFGGIPLDQAAFQHQRLELGSCHDHIEMVDVADHNPGLGAVGGGVLEILADAVFQFFGLAHIDDFILFIAHDIHTRCIGQA